MDIIENRDYHELLLMYKGKISPERLLDEAAADSNSLRFASVGYGVGNFYLYNGQHEMALKVLLRIMESQQQTSFGYIAAEAELKRIGVITHPRQSLPTRTMWD